MTHPRTRLLPLLASLIATLVLAAPAGAATFANGETITLPPDGPADGSPYPSEIEVVGLEGVVTDVDVTLRGLEHFHGQDLDILLVGPDGHAVVLMSDACGSDGWGAEGDSTFDASSANSMAQASPCPPGTYRPANFEDGDSDAWAETPDAELGDLAGSHPNGTWELYVRDDADHPGEDGARVGGGWEIDIETGQADVHFAIAAATVPEGGSAIVEVVRTADRAVHEGSVTVATASDTAFAGSDFVPTSYRLDFAAGETTKTVEVPVLADGLGEPEEGFSIALANPEGDARIGAPAAVGVTIPADPGGVPDDLPQGNEDPPAPPRFSIRNAFRKLPAVRRCRRRGSIIRFRPRFPDGIAIVRSELFVNGRKIEDNVEEAAVAPITLVMRGRRMRVVVKLHSHDGRVITVRRMFRACKRKRDRS